MAYHNASRRHHGASSGYQQAAAVKARHVNMARSMRENNEQAITAWHGALSRAASIKRWRDVSYIALWQRQRCVNNKR